MLATKGQWPHFAAGHVRANGFHTRNHAVNLAREHVLHGGAGAFVGHMGELGAGDLADQLQTQVVHAAQATGANADFAGVGLGIGDKFGPVGIGQIAAHGQHEIGAAHIGDADQRLGVVRQAGVQQGVGDDGGVVHQQVDRAVGPGLGHVLAADDGVGAGAVFHHDGLAQQGLRLDRDQPRQHVGCAARWVGHDKIHHSALGYG